jgi:hypothetical protein
MRNTAWKSVPVLLYVLVGCGDESTTDQITDAAQSVIGNAMLDAAPSDGPVATSRDVSVQEPTVDAQTADASRPDAFLQIATQATFASGVQPCGLAYDHVDGRVWVYPCFGAQVLGFKPDGTATTPAPRGGEMANDVDVDVAAKAFTLNQAQVSAGDLLFINGETGPTEIHVIDKVGVTVGTLSTAFGNSHVVGGAYHVARNTFFLVQDKVPGGENGNRVAEINLVTGQVLNSFQTTPNFIVDYGDLEVCQSTGHLFLVSSDEPTVAEFTPAGMFLNEYPLPAGVTGATGIGFDDATGNAWVSGTSGAVWQLSMPCRAFTGN